MTVTPDPEHVATEAPNRFSWGRTTNGTVVHLVDFGGARRDNSRDRTFCGHDAKCASSPTPTPEELCEQCRRKALRPTHAVTTAAGGY